MKNRVFALATSLIGLSTPDLRAVAPDFNREVRPILSDKCYHCHGPDENTRKGKLRLDTAEGAAKVLNKEHAAKSELVTRITSKDPDEIMPPPDGNIGKSLSAKEVETLKAWVAAGAPYARHWAFVPPVRPPKPGADRAVSTLDAFVRSRLAAEGMRPSPAAPPEVQARRLYLDLTGLPPSPAELAAFLEDKSPDAYAKLVERVLASPKYGERMTLLWMDLARYGDSSVYHADGPREMWGWRDWVIQAFSANMPFDQFTVEQLAGDLLPNATAAQKVATGFNRNHATTDEGGVIAEEFRVDYVVDRIKTTSNVWLGLSLECAQCHDHKYDPVTQAEYYQFYAYFNNTKDPGMQTRGGNTAPLVEIPDPEAPAKQQAAAEASLKALDALEKAREAKAKTKAFLEWSAPKEGSVNSDFPLDGVRFHLPCREADKAQLVSSLEGNLGSTGGVALSAAPGPKGMPAGALTLAGNAVARLKSDLQLEGHKPFTFAAWVKLASPAGTASVLTRMDAGGEYRGFDIGFDGGRPGVHLVHKWPSNALKAYALKPLSAKDWHHVVLTYDGSGKASGLRLFVDGQPEEIQASTDSLTESTRSTAPLVFGSRQDGSGFKGEVSAVTLWDRVLAPEQVPHTTQDYVDALRALPAELRPVGTELVLQRAFMLFQDKSDAPQRLAYAKALDAEQKASKGLSSVMIMEDLPPAQMRQTFVLSRGQYDAPLKDKEVKPGVPSVFAQPPEGTPQNRLGLARWLVDKNHPLTARVTVNRFWQMLFGEGLVKTSEDFGLQGEMPSHPELLDWLAVEFIESGWDVKGLLRKIVTSETYRQSSKISGELLEQDPQNRLLARGARFRLQAEFLRDGVLSVSGLLNPKVGGPSVKPYQPKGIWEEVALDTNLSKYVPDTGERLYRRSMYTYWKRSSPHPSMTALDATTREKCTGQRSRTNTPLQALVTLNDPQFVEAARAFAQRIIREGGPDPAGRISMAMRLALGRSARESEVRLLSDLARREQERFAQAPEKARQLLSVGESVRDQKIAPEEHAAWTVVANTVLNLDEFLVKP